MTTTPFRRVRHPVPNWPVFRVSVASGTLAVPRRQDVAAEITSELRTRLERWRQDRDLEAAAEVVETALVERQEAEALSAARSILASVRSMPPLKRQAALLLRRAGEETGLTGTESEGLSLAEVRRRTREAPQDPFSWADLSRAYVVERKVKEAERAMLVALQLAPANRHVLRSAARLFLHADDPERAHALLSRSEATRRDPWLMAGEIALAPLADANPRFFKAGTELVWAGRDQPRQLTELAAAIGTMHLLDGSRKANKLFRASLVDPTGNSLAQAEWATPKIGRLVRPEALVRVKDSGEAAVFQSYWDKDFRAVIANCERWSSEEPFSSRPLQMAAVAASTLEQFEDAIRLAKRGLILSPGSPALTNSYAFGLVSTGKYDDAERALKSAISRTPEPEVAAMIATAGMLALRLRHYDAGRDLYQKAISIFRKAGMQPGETLALAYYALESARSEMPNDEAALREAEQAAKKMPWMPELDIVLGRARAWRAAAQHRRSLEPQAGG